VPHGSRWPARGPESLPGSCVTTRPKASGLCLRGGCPIPGTRTAEGTRHSKVPGLVRSGSHRAGGATRSVLTQLGVEGPADGGVTQDASLAGHPVALALRRQSPPVPRSWTGSPRRSRGQGKSAGSEAAVLGKSRPRSSAGLWILRGKADASSGAERPEFPRLGRSFVACLLHRTGVRGQTRPPYTRIPYLDRSSAVVKNLSALPVRIPYFS
jgi:hypothetical protein